LVWDVVPFDARWVLLPGLATLGLCAGLLVLRLGLAGAHPRARGLLGAASVLLFLLAVWWTLGGLGAWRAGAGRLATGTANFVEGTVEGLRRGPDGAVLGFQVERQRFLRAGDAFAPALHATRWPTVPLASGQRARVWFFGEDVLRLEVAEAH
jgi:hypothetical protein